MKPIAIPLAKAPALVGLSRSTLYRLAASGDIRLIKVGRTTLIDCSSLDAFLASRPSVAPAGGAKPTCRDGFSSIAVVRGTAP